MCSRARTRSSPRSGSPRSRAARVRAALRANWVTLTLTVKMEGGHATFVEAHTDQMGESRLDRNVKKYFVQLHKVADPAHALDAAY